MLHLRLVDDGVRSGLSTDTRTSCSAQHSSSMGKAVFLGTVNKLAINFWRMGEKKAETLTRLALQLRHPWRDFVCGRFFVVAGLVSVAASTSILEHDDPVCDMGSRGCSTGNSLMGKPKPNGWSKF